MAQNFIDIRINRDSSIPAYRQIAEDLRYRIATGSIAPDEKLPTLRQGADQWGVNLHTVRQAYGALANAGLTELRRGRGTVVSARGQGAASARGEDLTAFLEWVRGHAAARFGLEPGELAALLALRQRDGKAGGQLPVMECSETQAAHHAAEISQAWDVETRSWSLEGTSEPPPGPLIATYFHYNDIRLRWPHRLGDVTFVSIRPAPALRQRLRRAARTAGVAKAVLYERTETMARNVAADVKGLLGESKIAIETRTVSGAPNRLGLGKTRLHLFPPRLWAHLTAAQRAQSHVFQVQYDIVPEELSALGLRFGWRPRAA